MCVEKKWRRQSDSVRAATIVCIVGDSMVAISFSVLKEQIKRGEKTQTIRRASPHWLKVQPGTTLHLFWNLRTHGCERLGEGMCSYRSDPIKFQDFDHDLAIQDGFTSLEEMQGWTEN